MKILTPHINKTQRVTSIETNTIADTKQSRIASVLTSVTQPLTPEFIKKQQEIKNPIFGIWVSGPIPKQYLEYMNSVATVAKKNDYSYIIYSDTPKKIIESIYSHPHELSTLKLHAKIVSLSELDSIYNALESEVYSSKKKPHEITPKTLADSHGRIRYLKNTPSHEYAFASDFYRTLALYKHGGCYLDVDFKTDNDLLRDKLNTFFSTDSPVSILNRINNIIQVAIKNNKKLDRDISTDINPLLKKINNIKINNIENTASIINELFEEKTGSIKKSNNSKFNMVLNESYDLLDALKKRDDKESSATQKKLQNATSIIEKIKDTGIINLPQFFGFKNQKKVLNKTIPTPGFNMLTVYNDDRGVVLANGLLTCDYTERNKMKDIILKTIQKNIELSKLNAKEYVRVKSQKVNSKKRSDEISLVNILAARNLLSESDFTALHRLQNRKKGSLLENSIHNGSSYLIVSDNKNNAYKLAKKNNKTSFGYVATPYHALLQSESARPIPHKQVEDHSRDDRIQNIQYPLGDAVGFTPTSQENNSDHWTKVISHRRSSL